VQQHFSHFLILDQEKIGMKFNKGGIVKGKMMNRDKIFLGGRNMQHIV
jgi:hypothetical protein